MRAPPRRSAKADRFEQEIEGALQPGCFIEYGVSGLFVEDLDRVEGKIARLADSAPGRAVALYETFLAGCYEKADEPRARRIRALRARAFRRGRPAAASLDVRLACELLSGYITGYMSEVRHE